MSDEQLRVLSAEVGERLLRARQSVTTAESCTGGWIAKAITDIPGSSAWFERGFVTYSNAAKAELIGVQDATLADYGAVSAEVVREMAQGALQAAQANYAIAVSGVAGPDGGSLLKPVGTVWFGFATAQGKVVAHLQHFSGDRQQVRRQATAWALRTLLEHYLEK